MIFFSVNHRESGLRGESGRLDSWIGIALEPEAPLFDDLEQQQISSTISPVSGCPLVFVITNNTSSLQRRESKFRDITITLQENCMMDATNLKGTSRNAQNRAVKKSMLYKKYSKLRYGMFSKQ